MTSTPESSGKVEQEVTPRLERFTARFVDQGLEQVFAAAYGREFARPTARRVCVFSGVAFSLFTVMDYLVLPGVHPWNLLIRFGLLVPFCAAAFMMTGMESYGRRHGAIMVSLLVVTVSVVAFVGAIGPSPGRELYLATATCYTLFAPVARCSVRATAVGGALSLVAVVCVCGATGIPWTTTAFLASNALALLAGGVVGAQIVESGARATFLQRRLVEAERLKSDQLLRNVLPGPIAARLKDSHTTIADSIEEVTVLFADIVGFTPMCAKLSADQVVERLDEVFTSFDHLATKHGIEKIKTIGDAYMAVAGAPHPSPSGASEIADLALDMLATVRDIGARFGADLSLRIGIHTGPAVAGVIGTRRFAYDLWGETVNTASRLESHSTVGRIQISEATRRRLAASHVVEERGEIELKGIGPVRTYFLVGRATAESAA